MENKQQSASLMQKQQLQLDLLYSFATS